ncbi:putative leucine-rich repeat protein [Leptomonas pyrrhocoris]|uniref:Putative leucine-rich repeat protein n=1 Tax=Leptomonas pyrrhocoris TaxID=157538 RepID=A0A0M9FWW3_LEPPY|nr:putative leucine-rich repeat protein [Leptomonas pyrrhocoris]KPA77546.1 putative leucine-rich repeat protein [Leptomonas pyrrhocoris]|eukprot:XP_015655985.1 putative leucine-rich repeat protein [Leptomonas pyrrhocoris]
MSVQLEKVRESHQDSAPATRDPTLASLAALLPRSTTTSTSTPTPSTSQSNGAPAPPPRSYTLVNVNSSSSSGVAVPLDRYRAKLEECATLHHDVDTLTRSNEAYQRRLAAQEAENAELRATIAKLQCVRQAPSANGDPASDTPTSAGLDSPPPPPAASAVAALPEAALEGATVESCAGQLTTSVPAPNDGCTPPGLCASDTAASALAGGTAADVAGQRDDRHAQPPASATHTSRSSSLSSSRSSTPNTAADPFAMPSRSSPRQPQHSTYVSAAEVTAYGRALSEILEAPLGPWEE